MWKKQSTLTNSENTPSSTSKTKGSNIHFTSHGNIVSHNLSIVKKRTFFHFFLNKTIDKQLFIIYNIDIKKEH